MYSTFGHNPHPSTLVPNFVLSCPHCWGSPRKNCVLNDSLTYSITHLITHSLMELIWFDGNKDFASEQTGKYWQKIPNMFSLLQQFTWLAYDTVAPQWKSTYFTLSVSALQVHYISVTGKNLQVHCLKTFLTLNSP